MAECRFGHVHQLRHVAQLNRFFKVFLDIVADFGYPSAFGSAYGVFGIILVADQDMAVGNRKLMQDRENSNTV